MRSFVRYAELLRTVAVANIKVQYRSVWFGFLWAIITPIIAVILYKVVFSFFLRIEIKEYPFFIYLMTAVFPWGFFQGSLVSGTESLVTKKALIREALVPRLLIPVSFIVSHAIHFMPVLMIMLVSILVAQSVIPFSVVLLPLVFLVSVIFLVGMVLCLSAIYVVYRDMKYAVGIAINVLFYLTPVFYPLTLVEECLSPWLFKLYMWNPFVGLINMYRICFLPGFLQTVPSSCTLFDVCGMAILESVCVCAFGIWYFQKQQKRFVDYLAV